MQNILQYNGWSNEKFERVSIIKPKTIKDFEVFECILQFVAFQNEKTFRDQ